MKKFILLFSFLIVATLSCFAEIKSFKRGSNFLDYEFRSVIYYDDADVVDKYYDYKQICLNVVNGPRLRYKKAEFVLDDGVKVKNIRHIDEDPMTSLDVCKQIMLTYGYMINEYVLVGKTYITEYFLIGKDKIAIRQWIVK